MNWLLVLVSVMTWLTPAPAHAEGLLVRYGPQWLVEQVATYREYDLSPYPERCGLSVMSPSDLGKTVWVKQADGTWFGPCLAMDVADRKNFARYVYDYGEVAELPNLLTERMGFCCGQWGEISISSCPPFPDSLPDRYIPPLKRDYNPNSITPSMWPYPAQQFPQACK